MSFTLIFLYSNYIKTGYFLGWGISFCFCFCRKRVGGGGGGQFRYFLCLLVFSLSALFRRRSYFNFCSNIFFSPSKTNNPDTQTLYNEFIAAFLYKEITSFYCFSFSLQLVFMEVHFVYNKGQKLMILC